MSFYDIPRHSMKAGENINPSVFVTQTTNDFEVVVSDTGELPFGVSQMGTRKFDATVAAATGETIGVYGFGQECYLTAGTDIVSGDKLKPSSAGLALVATSEDYGAVALSSGASGNLIKVLLRSGDQ